jgi:hypothetical protein
VVSGIRAPSVRVGLESCRERYRDGRLNSCRKVVSQLLLRALLTTGPRAPTVSQNECNESVSLRSVAKGSYDQSGRQREDAQGANERLPPAPGCEGKMRRMSIYRRWSWTWLKSAAARCASVGFQEEGRASSQLQGNRDPQRAPQA